MSWIGDDTIIPKPLVFNMELDGLLILLLIAGFGWLAGICVNYLCDMLPQRRLTNAFCAFCDQRLNFWRAYAWPSRCPACRRFRPLRHWIVYILYPVCSILIWMYPPARIDFLFGFLALLYFGVVVLIDIEHHMILLPVNTTGYFLGFAIGWVRNGFSMTLLGGVAALLFWLILYYAGKLFSRIYSRIRQGKPIPSGLGFGDVLLGGVIGLMSGWFDLPTSLVITILSAGLFSLALISYRWVEGRYQPGMLIPYAPFLAIGALYILYFE